MDWLVRKGPFHVRKSPWGERPTTKALAWLVLLALCLSCLAWWPMLAGYPRTQIHDGPIWHKMLEVARVSVTRYHELPLWDAYECGGVPLWDNPQGVVAAPLAWILLLVGTTAAIEIWYVVHSAAGFLCTWALARSELKLSPVASFVAAASWAFAGVHNQHFTGGHVVFVGYLYFPLALLLWRRAESSARAAVGLGVIVALIVLEGGTYPLPHLALLLGAETLLRLWPARRFVPIAKAAVVVVAVAFAVGAVRFIPLLDQFAHHQRVMPEDTDSMQWITLRDMFLSRDHDRAAPGQQYVWPEFGDYLGPFVFGLSVLGVLMLQRSELWMLVLFAFSFALMCGHFSPYAPWSLLTTYVFPFKEMRVPSRMVEMVTLFLSLFAALAVDRLPRRLRIFGVGANGPFHAFLVAIALVGVGDEISVGTSWVKQAFQGPPQDLAQKPAGKVYVTPTLRSAFLDVPHMDLIDLGCWEEWSFEHDAPLWAGNVAQARGATAAVRVISDSRTPNTFTVTVQASQPGRVLLNSAYERNWQTDVGEVVEANKLLAVDVPAGEHTLYLRYWPHGLTVGIFLSSLSVLGLLVWTLHSRFRRPAPRPASTKERATVAS
jgi:hypothetical protein